LSCSETSSDGVKNKKRMSLAKGGDELLLLLDECIDLSRLAVEVVGDGSLGADIRSRHQYRRDLVSREVRDSRGVACCGNLSGVQGALQRVVDEPTNGSIRAGPKSQDRILKTPAGSILLEHGTPAKTGAAFHDYDVTTLKVVSGKFLWLKPH